MTFTLEVRKIFMRLSTGIFGQSWQDYCAPSEQDGYFSPSKIPGYENAWRSKRKDNIDRDFSLGRRKRRNFVRPNKKMRDSRLALTNRMEGEGHLWVCTLSQIRPSRNYACWPSNTCETFARKKFQVYYERCTG